MADRRNRTEPLSSLLVDLEAQMRRYEQNGGQEAAAAAVSRAEAEAAAERSRLAAALPAEQLAWLVELGVPAIEAEVAVLGPEPWPAVQCLSKVSKRRPILVLAGDTGCGKTVAGAHHLLTTAGPALDRSQCVGAFTTAVDFGRLWPRHVADRDRLRALEQAAALVIDDLGTEEEDVRSKLDHLIYQRAGNRRPTIITANMNWNDFRSRYEERVWSRLEQSGNFEAIAEPDYRVAQRRSGH